MACNYPIKAYKDRDGGIIFDETKGDVVQWLHLPCGVCEGCRLERSRQWALRCVHEASLYERNCFITLTYNNEHLTEFNNLCYSDFQLFMKRLRKKFQPIKIRFFMCGEYGDKGDRPHYHACLFNIDFNDRVYFKTSKSGSKIYTSKTLDNLWCDRNGDSIGYATVGDVNFDSAGYVARYIMKKRLGRNSERFYDEINLETGEVNRRTKEFNKMSLKPGIGSGFYDRWRSDMFPKDIAVVNGKATKPPKYYFKKLKESNPEMYEEIGFMRHGRALKSSEDNTEERLLVKEQVLKARSKLLIREMERG